MWLPVYHPYQVHDVFFWLIFQGNEDMVRHTWARCTLPVHVALLGSAIANKMVPLMFPTRAHPHPNPSPTPNSNPNPNPNPSPIPNPNPNPNPNPTSQPLAPIISSPYPPDQAAALPEPSKTRSRTLAYALQDWAYGLMETANSHQATKILELQVCEDFIRPNACMDVAMATGAEELTLTLTLTLVTLTLLLITPTQTRTRTRTRTEPQPHS